jgi:predicted DNA-binding protein with PD1-like motif
MSDVSVSPILVRLVPGESLLESIENVCAERGVTQGWVRALGTVSDVRMSTGVGSSETAVVTNSGATALASFDASLAPLNGRPMLRAFAVVSFDAAGVWTTRGGQIGFARVDNVEVCIYPSDESVRRVPTSDGRVLLQAGAGGASASASPSASAPVAVAPRPAATSSPAPSASAPSRAVPAPTPAPSRPAAAPAVPSAVAAAAAAPSAWDRVAQASSRLAEEDEEDDGIDSDELKPGDKLRHPHLGDCRVQMINRDGSANVALPEGRNSKLLLRPFRIVRLGQGLYELVRKQES